MAAHQICTERGVMSRDLARAWRCSKFGRGSSSKDWVSTASCSRVILHRLERLDKTSQIREV